MRRLLVLATLLLLISGAAMADSWFFDFTTVDVGIRSYGNLYGISNGNGTFTITSGTIHDNILIADGVIVANPAPGTEVSISPSGYFNYDNQLMPTANPLVDNAGLLFLVRGIEVNIFSNGPGPLTYVRYDNTGLNVGDTFSIVSTPEPGAVSMLVTMLAGLAGLAAVVVLRRKLA